MKSIKPLFALALFLALTLHFSSCVPILSMSAGVKNKKILVDRENDRTVVVISMIHVQKPEFYAEVKECLDSLKAEGYVVFYEIVQSREPRQDKELSDEQFEYALKFRRLTGYDFGQNRNKQPRGLRTGRYVKQSVDLLGLTTEQDIWADMYLEDLIDMYEDQYGEVELTDYDRSTPLAEDYEWKKGYGHNGSSYFLLMHLYRDKYLADMISESDHSRIVVVFGSAHYHISLSTYLSRMGFTELTKKELRAERKKQKQQ